MLRALLALVVIGLATLSVVVVARSTDLPFGLGGGDRGPEEDVRHLRERVPELLERKARATIITLDQLAEARAQRAAAPSLPEDQRVSWSVAARAEALTREVWVEELARGKADEARAAIMLAFLGSSVFTGYRDIWFEVVSWDRIEVAGDEARASLVGRHHRTLNPSPVVSGPERHVDRKTRYELRIDRGADGTWRLRSIDETSLEPYS